MECWSLPHHTILEEKNVVVVAVCIAHIRIKMWKKTEEKYCLKKDLQ